MGVGALVLIGLAAFSFVAFGHTGTAMVVDLAGVVATVAAVPLVIAAGLTWSALAGSGVARPVAPGPVAALALVIAIGVTGAVIQLGLARAGLWDGLLSGGITGVYTLGLAGAAVSPHRIRASLAFVGLCLLATIVVMMVTR
jgi:hypothetical protein